MDYIDDFFERLLRSEQLQTHRENSCVNLSQDEIKKHLRRSLYGTFQLTEAIRPSHGPVVVPTAGYRHDMYHNRETGVDIPVIIAAASRERLIDLFHELLDPLGETVNIVLESSHDPSQHGHADFYREGIDTPVLRSTFYDFEDVLLDDGEAGVAVIDPSIPAEVQFDEHKLLIVYGHDLTSFEEILDRHQVKCREGIRFISESGHFHSSSNALHERFEQLKCEVGADTVW